MKDRLRSIYQQHGEEPFRHGSMLLNIHNDLFPREEQDRRLLKLLLMCKGNTLLLDARKKAIGEQSVAITRLIKQMQADWGLRDTVAREVVSAFWLAIGGSPDALNTLEDRMPERAPAPNPVPAPAPTPTVPNHYPPPAHAVYRRSDYVIEDMAGHRRLKKYTGSDPVIQIPDGVHEIAEDAFVHRSFFGVWKSSSNVKEIYFPASLRTIQPRAFWNCTQLEKIVFHRHCSASFRRSIKEEAFAGCSSLHTVIIESRMDDIAWSAFAGCHVTEVIAPDHWKKDHQHQIFRIMHPSRNL